MKMNNENQKTVALVSLGCKVNQCESASFQSRFEELGFTVTPLGSSADIYVINTCAVTAKAAAQSRQLIRRVQRTNPHAKIVVTGCYAQIAPQKIREITSSPLVVVGNANKHELVEAALSPEAHLPPSGENQAAKFFNDIANQAEMSQLPANRFPGRTRAFLKVQDGCNNFCSYCIVPHARGRSRSLAPDEVLNQAQHYAMAGHREIVLTGIHLGHYGQELHPRSSLLELLEKLSGATPEIRYRLSSLEPTEISPALLELMANTENLMPHLHIPLQSGSGSILKSMQRRYTPEDFMEKVHRCKELLPAAAIGADVLVGFPGETEKDFMQTYELVLQLPVTYLHVFPYSKRPGTPAALMADQVAKEIKEERVAVLRKLDHKKRIAFHESRIGAIHPVLVEAEQADTGWAKGFTDNYIPVRFPAEHFNADRVVAVKLERVHGRQVIGNCVQSRLT